MNMAAPRRIWTVEKEDKLAELWQGQRALYDISRSIYHDRVVRDDILQRIASESMFLARNFVNVIASEIGRF
ncbi:hypothetical protein ROHU_022161 [Labeo rohita]|uniref:Uncharacterized protein n=1 Tax=Labeo rohita TaxID=84645 RepID=A0A498MXI4_LABRO|nr:hypothetical protein ROHU_022161 [Labeo rohita]